MKRYPIQIFSPPAGLTTFVNLAQSTRKRYLPGPMAHMYNVQPFLGEEFLDSEQLGRGKIQEMLQEYIPLGSCLTYAEAISSCQSM